MMNGRVIQLEMEREDDRNRIQAEICCPRRCLIFGKWIYATIYCMLDVSWWIATGIICPHHPKGQTVNTCAEPLTAFGTVVAFVDFWIHCLLGSLFMCCKYIKWIKISESCIFKWLAFTRILWFHYLCYVIMIFLPEHFIDKTFVNYILPILIGGLSLLGWVVHSAFVFWNSAKLDRINRRLGRRDEP